MISKNSFFRVFIGAIAVSFGLSCVLCSASVEKVADDEDFVFSSKECVKKSEKRDISTDICLGKAKNSGIPRSVGKFFSKNSQEVKEFSMHFGISLLSSLAFKSAASLLHSDYPDEPEKKGLNTESFGEENEVAGSGKVVDPKNSKSLVRESEISNDPKEPNKEPNGGKLQEISVNKEILVDPSSVLPGTEHEDGKETTTSNEEILKNKESVKDPSSESLDVEHKKDDETNNVTKENLDNILDEHFSGPNNLTAAVFASVATVMICLILLAVVICERDSQNSVEKEEKEDINEAKIIKD